MRALVLGGTGFVGRHTVDALVARGHEVTLFRRGRSNPGLYPDLEHVTGDRDGDLAALGGRTWDVVIDPSGYLPGQVSAALRAVAHADLHYIFVSSISVYSDWTRPNDESGPVHALDGHEGQTPLSVAAYGRLKVACERAAEDALPGRVLSVRAGLILGPHDYDARFPWWLRRMARGGEVLAPGDPDGPVQLIDARDLAAWMVSCAEKRVTGVVNATGPATPLTRRAVLETIRDVVGSDARLTWVPDEILLAHQVRPTSEMPFWLPASYAGGFRTHVEKAVATGMTYRPFVETARDEWQWLERDWESEASVRTERALQLPAAGMSAEREAEILAAARRAAR